MRVDTSKRMDANLGGSSHLVNTLLPKNGDPGGAFNYAKDFIQRQCSTSCERKR
jgi:hypothetical protein